MFVSLLQGKTALEAHSERVFAWIYAMDSNKEPAFSRKSANEFPKAGCEVFGDGEVLFFGTVDHADAACDAAADKERMAVRDERNAGNAHGDARQQTVFARPEGDVLRFALRDGGRVALPGTKVMESTRASPQRR